MTKINKVTTEILPENEVVESPKKNEYVEVKKEDLDALFKRLDKQAKDIEMLYDASDKNSLARAKSKGGSDVLIHTAKVRVWSPTGKRILAWTNMKTNKAEIIMGKVFEDQSTTLILQEGEPLTVSYLELVRNSIQYDTGEIISRENQFDVDAKQYNEILHLEFSNGEKLKINSKFVN